MGLLRRGSSPTVTDVANNERPASSSKSPNGAPQGPSTDTSEVNWNKMKAPRSKYCHVTAYHSRLRHSSLSRDSNIATSFLGFRNLMVIVLGRVLSCEFYFRSET